MIRISPNSVQKTDQFVDKTYKGNIGKESKAFSQWSWLATATGIAIVPSFAAAASPAISVRWCDFGMEKRCREGKARDKQ
jgi:hypothetical protein